MAYTRVRLKIIFDTIYMYINNYMHIHLLIYKEANQNKIQALSHLVKIIFSQLHDWSY